MPKPLILAWLSVYYRERRVVYVAYVCRRAMFDIMLYRSNVIFGSAFGDKCGDGVDG